MTLIDGYNLMLDEYRVMAERAANLGRTAAFAEITRLFGLTVELRNQLLPPLPPLPARRGASL